ncbi:DNA methyltransferase [Pseudomonas chengduensis]
MTVCYEKFLQDKVCVAPTYGFEVLPELVNPNMKPHCRAIVPWLLAGGRRALFASFGLHKTVIQLEFVRLASEHAGGRGLITLPLGVVQEFRRDAVQRLGWAEPPRFIRSIEEAGETGVYLTNYETVRDGKLDPRDFVATSLDEADVLRGFGGSKTFREFMRLFAGDDRQAGIKTEGIRYRLVATATPSPNDYIELLAYAAYLGVMDVGAAKTRFFKRNSEKADELTIHPHKEEEFWLWVASWALFIQKPSDLGFSDEGYSLPEIELHWHELPSDHRQAGAEKDGQGRLFSNAAIGVQDAARVKRDSLAARVGKVVEILRQERASVIPGVQQQDLSTPGQPGSAPICDGLPDQVVIWCDLNSEQVAIEKALDAEGISYSSLTGSMDVGLREKLVEQWRNKETTVFLSKPVMYGAGVNLQQSHTMIFAGIGFKAKDVLQAVHRIQRFQQTHQCTAHFIHTEAERDIRRQLEKKWRQHNRQADKMTQIIREFGLAHAAMAQQLARSLGVERVQASGEHYTVVNNDCVLETQQMQADSVHLIMTSIPFGNQYEYSPSYNDFGHTDDSDHFWQQMDFLIPELYRVLQPGRIAAIHVKDRITPSGISGMGFQVVEPFSDQCTAAFRKHGFGFLARKSIITDVVRENNQTYRLGWTEQCKDGSRMGAGMPEYLLLFRKPPTDRSNGYADVPVVKSKEDFTRPRWQFDAHGFMRSSGNRPLLPEDLDGLEQAAIFQLFKKHSLENVYDFRHDVMIAEHVDKSGWLPSKFMLLQPQSWHPDVWTDITRMLTLNSSQAAKGREQHICPLQFDIVDRAIEQYTMPGEVVYDPFGGIGTTPVRAVKLKRYGRGCELSPPYFLEMANYCAAEERGLAMPDLFALLDAEQQEGAE